MSMEKKQCISKGNLIFTVTDLYREIGRIFREYGADKVILIKAKNRIENDTNDNLSNFGFKEIWKNMSLEIAADNLHDKEQLEKKCSELWPGLEVLILNLDEDANLNLMDEVMEDGILL